MSDTRVRAVIELDGKLLLVRNKSSAHFWCLPGGKVEPGEDIQTALLRELIEETGIEPVIGNILFVHQFLSDGAYGAPEFLFHVSNGRDYLDLDITKSTHGVAELAEIAFKDVESVEVLPSFLKTDLPDIIGEKFAGPVRLRIVG